MTFIKSLIFLILFPLLLAVIFSGCSSKQWERKSPVLRNEYDIFDTSSVTGTGFKHESHSYKPRKCIKNSDSSVTGGQLNFEFLNPSAVLAGERVPYRDYIKSAILRASAYNITGMKPFSIACIVSVSGRMNYLIENSIQLNEDAVSFLQKNDIDGFYRLCGTEFVDSTLFEAAVAFVVTYYLPPEDYDYFSSRIKYGKEAAASDVTNLSIFTEAGKRYPAFFSVCSVTDDLFIPLEFPIDPDSKNGSDDLIKRIIQACLASRSGTVTALQLKKWRDLPGINMYIQQRPGDVFAEDSYERIEALTNKMREFSIFRIMIGMHETEKNNEIISSLTEKINWSNFYKCSWGISNNNYLTPDQEKDCENLVQGLNNYSKIEAYNPFVDRLEEKDISIITSLTDLRLIDKSAFVEDDDYSESEYRFNDKTLYVNIPKKITPGQTVDAMGNIYSSDCFRKDTVTFITNKGDGISSIHNDCLPAGYREWGIIKKLFMFWKKPPAKQPLYRGNLEITGFSKELSDDFKITDEAADLARKDLMKFYEKFGTHYVSQVRGRRGIVYYFSLNSEKDEDIKIDSYGISQSPINKINAPLPVDLGGGCMFSIMGKLMSKLFNQELSEPLLHPATVNDFFKTKKDFARIMKEDSESVPVELYLKPWSQYLVYRGIIRIDQTFPVTLFRDNKINPADGIASITDGDGDTYNGMLSNGLKNGYGILKTRSGSVYEGNWMGDLMHGRGVYKHKDGNIYSGDFMYGYPHGIGENKGASGNLYRGAIYKSKLTGDGEMIYKDGRKYKGEFKNGEPDGHGIMEFSDGKKIEGYFRKGLFLNK